MDLTPRQNAEAQRLVEALQAPFLDEARRRAALLASQADAPLLGKTECAVEGGRDALGRRRRGRRVSAAGAVPQQ